MTLSLQVEYSVLYASASDLTELALLAMNASLPSGFHAASASEALTIKPATNLSVSENGSARWTMNAERKIIQFVDPAQVTQLIQGYASGSAQSRLEKNLPLASSPHISLSPAVVAMGTDRAIPHFSSDTMNTAPFRCPILR